MSKHAAVSQLSAIAGPLSAVQRKFILHWGEMGTRWGVNRTVAQVHALLFISPQPLNADDIVEALEVARSNVSTSLKELQGWGIVRLVHVQADKRDHFESLKDLYGFFETTTTLYAQVRRWTPAAIMKFMKAGDKVLKALGLGA